MDLPVENLASKTQTGEHTLDKGPELNIPMIHLVGYGSTELHLVCLEVVFLNFVAMFVGPFGILGSSQSPNHRTEMLDPVAWSNCPHTTTIVGLGAADDLHADDNLPR